MVLTRQIAMEMTKALAVMALVLLSFAHQPSAIASGNVELLTPNLSFAVLSFCGDRSDDDRGSHAPCHACRAGAAELPAPPCVAEPAYTAFLTFEQARAYHFAIVSPVHTPGNPRAPPALV